MYYYQPSNPFTSTTVIEKSKFIASLSFVANESDAKSSIELIKKNHAKANHNCYAYIVLDKNNNLVMNQSDDGEPSKTAGLPILEQLRHANMLNTLAVVTRYFGGTLLGTGGLIRAYSGVIKDGLTKVELTPVELLKGYKVTTDYTSAKHLEYLLNKQQTKIYDIEYHHAVTFEIYTNNPTLLEVITSINRESIIQPIAERWI
ncbi:YigZ family protein [Thorsellia kenyensis]|uniref:YigZ family protein n=1 Tax=Thorsellia kenyensis TaxID=1549888 RepID=A0ABV6CBA6_9GAMM